MDLIIVGDARDGDGHHAGAELWRVPFRGWGVPHRLRAAAWCRPRRFTVVGDGLVRAAGYTNDPTVQPGEVFVVEIAKPPRS